MDRVPPLDLYLASTSPRRRELLAAAGFRFELCEPGLEYAPGGGDEYASQRGEPRELAVQRAMRKGLGAVVPDARVPVLAVDTTVDLDGQELGKPRDRADAAAMLQRLVGRQHRVHTAHFVRHTLSGRTGLLVASAEVFCGQPDPVELAGYLDSGQWRGKAGSYGVQDAAQGFFCIVAGSFDTVVGLHVASVRELLLQLRGPS